jgi:guanylate kinase
MTQGTIYIISAASGTGKTTLVKELAKALPNIIISISHTTRPKRPNEQDGKDYFFITEIEFKTMQINGIFLESAEVFGNYYGTSYAWLKEQLQKGIDVILEIDWQGAEQVKKISPYNSISIFILPPSLEILEKRLLARKQDTKDIIQKRLAAASSEIKHAQDFDYIVVNDRLDLALNDLVSIVKTQRLRVKK